MRFLDLFADFNPLARMGRDVSLTGILAFTFDFNPLARMGRDPCAVTFSTVQKISIHSPVWGETVHFF